MNPTLTSFSSLCTTYLSLKSLSLSALLLAFPSPKSLYLRTFSAKPDSVLVLKPNGKNRVVTRKLKSFVKTTVFVDVIALIFGKLSNFSVQAKSYMAKSTVVDRKKGKSKDSRMHTSSEHGEGLTVLMYLSDVEEGGETIFSTAKGNVSDVS